MNLRDLAERDLATTLEGDWGVSIALLSPSGVWQRALKGQVLYDTVRLDPESAERVVTSAPVVVLRRSRLAQIPLAGERWLIEVPSAPTIGAPAVQFVLNPNRPPEGGTSIGFIRLYLQAVDQVELPPAEEPPVGEPPVEEPPAEEPPPSDQGFLDVSAYLDSMVLS